MWNDKNWEKMWKMFVIFWYFLEIFILFQKLHKNMCYSFNFWIINFKNVGFRNFADFLSLVRGFSVRRWLDGPRQTKHFSRVDNMITQY